MITKDYTNRIFACHTSDSFNEILKISAIDWISMSLDHIQSLDSCMCPTVSGPDFVLNQRNAC